MKPVGVARFHERLRSAIAALPDAVLNQGAAAHGLDAILGYAVLQGLMPAGQSGCFVDAYKSRLAIDLSLQTPLEHLSQTLASAGVPALLLKGEAWARAVYPVAGVRGRCDCDIWVPRQLRDRAISVLNSLDLHEVRPYACAGEVLTPEALFRGMGLSIDLHWQLNTLCSISRGLDFEDCWRTSIPVPGLRGWRMLGPVEALLHAAMHFYSPGRVGYRWIWALDGLLLLDWAAIDPAVLQDRAAEARIADLWQNYMDYTRCLEPAAKGSLKVPAYRSGQDLRLLLTRAPLHTRLRILRELLWPRAAFLRDRYPDSGEPLYRLQLRRWLSSAKKIARQT